MAVVRRQFGGLNSDLSPLKLASGTATDLLNVTLDEGKLRKRMGFTEYEDAVSSTTAVLGLFVAHFKTATYVIAKLADSYLYQRQIYPSAASSFTKITTTHTHDTTNAGWAYMWADRFIYNDTGGASQWHPLIMSGIAFKAGLPKPSNTPRLAKAATGEKHGKYHVHYSLYCSYLDVEGVISEPSVNADDSNNPGATTSRIDASGGGLTVSNCLMESGYESDMIRVYCTMGDTEIKEVGGTERDTFSYRAYMDVQTDPTSSNPGLNRADESLDKRMLFTNAGGEPPASRCGAWTGGVCVYARGDPGTAASTTVTPTGDDNDFTLTAVDEGIWGNRISITVATGSELAVAVAANDAGGYEITVTLNGATSTGQNVVDAINADSTAAALVTASNASGNDGRGTLPDAAITEAYLTGGLEVISDKILYSIPFRPTMVPKDVTYSSTTYSGGPTDSRTIIPRPWKGETRSGVDGEILTVANAGGTIAMYTATSTWLLRSAANGQLYPVMINGGMGCVEHGAACNAGTEIHALGYRCWTVTTAGSFQNIAQDRFTTTLEDVPVAQQQDARMACYHYKNQVWCAVTKSGDTVAQRILVWDRSVAEGELTIFEPDSGFWASGEGITAMCELSYLGAEPTMLVATNKGRILRYPHTSARDYDSGGNTDYEARWKGIFAPEFSQWSQQVQGIEVHTGDNCAEKVQWRVRAKRTGGDSPDRKTGFLTKDNGINPVQLPLEQTHGRLYEVEFFSSAQDTGQWEIDDVTVKTARTDRVR